jgi:hypothetical protein
MSDIKVTYGTAPAEPAETPSAALVKDGNRVVFVTDARGRQLGVKRGNHGLSYFRLTRLLGADAGNTPLINQAAAYASVVSIDGDPVPFPNSLLQLEALIDRVDIDGFNTVMTVQHEVFGLGKDETETAKN